MKTVCSSRHLSRFPIWTRSSARKQHTDRQTDKLLATLCDRMENDAAKMVAFFEEVK
jgi:hypothetical protein